MLRGILFQKIIKSGNPDLPFVYEFIQQIEYIRLHSRKFHPKFAIHLIFNTSINFIHMLNTKPPICSAFTIVKNRFL